MELGGGLFNSLELDIEVIGLVFPTFVPPAAASKFLCTVVI